MLNTKHQIERSYKHTLMAGAVFGGLLVVAIATAWLVRSNVLAAPSFVAQEAQNQVTFPVPFENSAEFPLVITQAAMSLGDVTEAKSTGELPNGHHVEQVHKAEAVRLAMLEAKLQNQSNQRITEIAVQIENAPLWGAELFLAISKVSPAGDPEAENAGVTEQQGYFKLKAPWEFADKSNGRELMNHLQDFRLRLTGVRFEGEGEMRWLKGMKVTPPPTTRKMIIGVPRKKTSEQLPPNNFDKRVQDEPVHQMSASLRPKITYRERARYTKEARDQKVEGTVVLSAEYGADGVMRDIKVERGLPYGLTESAIEAAKAIRFDPAMKDGQPVSVRGKMEFYFSLGQ